MKSFWLIVCLIACSSCIEEFKGSMEHFESVLVIEATITNENKHQVVKLSRSYRLEEEGPSNESNANVTVQGENGEIYEFEEMSDGIYRSIQAFAAQENYDYVLEIETSNGRQYKSKSSRFLGSTQIDDLYVQRGINEDEEEGVFVLLNTYDASQKSKYYRYEYEETYKIIAPRYSPYDLHIENDDFVYYPGDLVDVNGTQEFIEFFVSRHPRPEPEQICYNTVKSKSINLLDATDFESYNVVAHPVRFLNRNNYIISHRYSILVKQYVQSIEAYLFYETLKSFSESESIFSQVQTGFVQGNIASVSNSKEKVMGYFEVVPMDEKRVYFNYADLFPDEELPPYYSSCNLYNPELVTIHIVGPGQLAYVDSPLQWYILQNFQYYEENVGDEGVSVERPYRIVLPACGDCTVLGQTEIPEFWIE